VVKLHVFLTCVTFHEPFVLLSEEETEHSMEQGRSRHSDRDKIRRI
jgi:hypothetical protein